MTPMRSAEGEAIHAPVIAVIIPGFRHSVLLSEAITSILAQDCEQDIVIVLVNDGCPLVETHQVCSAFALRYPGKIFYVRRANGGLSAARNTGIRFALHRWASVAAVYLLDADNRLYPPALGRAYARMAGDKNVAWVYPNIDMFGIAANFDYGGMYSVLAHTQDNICEAGSLIARRVFEAGVWFDEAMRHGYEDWEFWLQAVERGFRGVHEPLLGFQYRKRAESMLSDSGRVHDEIVGYIKRKHPKLFQPKGLARLEAQYAPRFAIYVADTGKIFLTGDPANTISAVTFDELDLKFWRAQAEPSKEYFPPFIVTTNSQTLEILSKTGMLRWAFWTLESGLSQAPVAALFLDGSGPQNTILVKTDIAHGEAASVDESAVLMLPTRVFVTSVVDPHTVWINSLNSEDPSMPVAQTRLTIAQPMISQVGIGNASSLLSLFSLFRHSRYREQALVKWNWRNISIKPKHENYLLLRKELGEHAIGYPIVESGGFNVGFLLPIAEFGGVEKVTHSVAQELRNHGWNVHLFLMGNNKIELPPAFAATFQTINILPDPSIASSGGSGTFYGTWLPSWGSGHDTSNALGLLFWLDVVINCHSLGSNEVMGQLRRFGVTIVNYLHVIDRTPLHMPTGHPVVALAYEHVYDLIITCSNALARWMHGMGVPREKLLVIKNGPGFPMPEDQLEPLIAKRDAFAPEMNVLYMGRLDRQKGLVRLADVVRHTRSLRPPVKWRIVGRSILKDDEASIATMAGLIEPPVMSERAIMARLGWAHVLVLPSHWEGMPLIVIEALHCGVVVIATNVGAMAEIIEDGVNGFLVPNDGNAAAAMTKIISQLSRDRDLLQRMAAAAAVSARHFSWQRSVAPLINYLEEKKVKALAG